jgi:hypothetical protein
MIVDVSPRVLEILSITEDQLLAMTLSEFVEAVHDMGYMLSASSVAKAGAGGGMTITVCTEGGEMTNRPDEDIAT